MHANMYSLSTELLTKTNCPIITFTNVACLHLNYFVRSQCHTCDEMLPGLPVLHCSSVSVSMQVKEMGSCHTYCGMCELDLLHYTDLDLDVPNVLSLCIAAIHAALEVFVMCTLV